jgi:hypothetical protein
VTKAGQAVTMDIIPNVEPIGLTKASHFKFYLLICDVYSRFAVMIGMKDKSSKSVIDAVSTYLVTYKRVFNTAPFALPHRDPK